MDIVVANARQLTSIQQELYEWQKLDAVYARLTDSLLAQLHSLWMNVAGVSPSRWVTAGDINAAASSPTANRFFPSLNFTYNPRNWNELTPFCPPVLLGYNLDDSATPVGIPNAQIAEVGAVAFQWITARLHRSEGTLQRVALLLKGRTISEDALKINSMLSSAFSE